MKFRTDNLVITILITLMALKFYAISLMSFIHEQYIYMVITSNTATVLLILAITWIKITYMDTKDQN